MIKISESQIESFAIQLFEHLGYKSLYGPDIAPDGPNPLRVSLEEVVLKESLRKSVQRINHKLPVAVCEDAVNEVLRIASPDLLANNEQFHRMLTEGISVSVHRDGAERGELVWLIDFDNPLNNEFTVVNQYTIVENGRNKRPDLILFVNGLPLVVIELKNAADENATLQSAFRQVETYKEAIPSLFTYNELIVVSDGLEARAGSLSAGFSRMMAWKSADGKAEASRLVSQLEVLIQGMLNRESLLDLIRSFTVFEKTKTEDVKTKITTIKTVKKVAAYHQYYAVNKAIESTIRATGINRSSDYSLHESPVNYGLEDVKSQPVGDHKAGVVWHTQGSGKSLSMVFYVGKVVRMLNNPTIVVITDRNDLDDQLLGTFADCRQLLRQTPVQAEDGEKLKNLLSVNSGGVIFTTIQKFQPEKGKNIYKTLTERSNVIVIADEAHRTQYGFKAKSVEVKNEADEVIGSEIKYGFAKYLRDALPNATYLGFTGTPIETADVNTPAVFGNYIDVYDIAQAVEDGATVRIFYESRLAKIELSEEGRKLIESLDRELETEEMNDVQLAKAKWTQLEALIGNPARIKNIARDIVTHFEQRQEVFEGKAMVVAMSRRIAVALYNAIIALRPHWHSDDLDKGAIKVVMTSASSDGPDIARHHTTKGQRRLLAERMKDPDDELKLVIVRDMWLTGFDAPCLHTLYIDKPMQGHNLMQAIARVNRVYKDKPGGLVVDYLGIASDLKKALSFYSDSGGKGNPTEQQEQAVALMEEKLEVVQQLLYGFDYHPYFTADVSQKLSFILQAEDFILGQDNGKKRFVNEVNALSKAFAIAIPHERAMEVKEEIAFFQAVKARLCKFDLSSSHKTDEEIETTIRQVVDKALVSEKVVDIFDAAGIKKPDISILSEEFLMELKGMEHKNIALEVLRKLLNDEIKARMQRNLVQGKSLMEMLEASINKYHNKVITAVEVIDELIGLSKHIVAQDNAAKKLGLSEYEYAFYSAVADNNSAMELMGKDKLRELAVVLTETIRSNASIDWEIKENVRAKMRVAIKRLLRRFGYPPDMQMLATETVIKQAEMISAELLRK
ncbi:type I restriction endonuclease subunit R [uncultured Phocaeicola sp.]|uniref:type I restriction endonuclease subunit R n=1 Tax=uncultured Phocaeicola sp. TaxID=990718 RepID=UPI0030C65F8B